MGMAMSSVTLVPQLAQRKLIPQATFSLCFSAEGGNMVLGGVDDTLWEEPVQYTPLLHASGWFTVELQVWQPLV